MTETLNMDSAIKFLGLKRSSIYKLISNGKLIAYKPGGKKFLFKQSDLENYAFQNKHGESA